MRNFEERKEEIFRRSEQRILQRKKTVRRVVLTCVPLVLCVSALSGYLLLGGFGRMDNAAPESAMEPNYSMQDAMEESPECLPEFAQEAISLQISDGNQSKTYTEQEVLYTFQCMLTLPPEEAADNAGIPESIEEPKQDGNFSAQGASEYTLILTLSDGSREVYDLVGHLLTGPYGAYNLTDTQLLWIRSVLKEED